MRKQLVVLSIGLICVTGLIGQVKKGWQHLDLHKDGVFGVSSVRAYQELLRNKSFKPIVVAVLDSGTDTAHPDLHPVLWKNKKEADGTANYDNDRNGYIGDVRGWNFIGGKGGEIQYENLEQTRLIRNGKADDSIRAEFARDKSKAERSLESARNFKQVLDGMLEKMQKDTTNEPSQTDFANYTPAARGETAIKSALLGILSDSTASFKAFYQEQLVEVINHFQIELKYKRNLRFNPRSIVGDDTLNVREKYYGNSNVSGPDAEHGTHVAGIIAADRTGKEGIIGIADHVQIMTLRIVPEGDERDKDVANAIRYAVDNGAKVINMSFGKGYSPDKSVVDEAVKYAMSKDVLLIHAAGNDNKNIDSARNFPTKTFLDGLDKANAWIEVGASGPKDDSTLAASFSNYGKKSVDVFAPGVRIYSCVPGGGYKYYDGTSMAAPIVTGLAALIREYYPSLSAVQVKDIIMQSVTHVDHEVNVVVNGVTKKIPFADLCVSGGVVNAYNAIKLAEEGSRNIKKKR